MTEIKATVAPEDAGRKIKYYVRSNMRLSYQSYCRIKAVDGLRVNGAVVHANYELRAGDEISALLPSAPPEKEVAPENLPVNIVYRDQSLYIIDKSAPLACQCTPKQPNGTLENRLKHYFSEEEAFVFRPLNRLDKGTSGLMAAAMNAHTCQLMQKELHSDRFIREYLAVCEGVLEGEGTIRLPIAKDASASVRRIVDYERGVPSVTHYRAIENNGVRTLVRLRLETGRTHQIRVHLSAIGHPICGDFLYGTELPELPERFALHSHYISLTHPMSGKTLSYQSPLPAELEALMKK